MHTNDPGNRDLTRQIKSTSDVVLELHDLGGGGDELLLVHATGFHAMVWQPLASLLDGYHSWAPDMRGHGNSSSPVDNGFDWSGFADDVLAVVDFIEANRANAAGTIRAVGHSKGGAALLLAEQRRPGTFKSMYLYEPVVFPPQVAAMAFGASTTKDIPIAAGALRRRETFSSAKEAFDNFASKPPLDVLDPEVLHAYVDHGFSDEPDGSIRLKCRPEDEAAVYRAGMTHHAFDHLGEVGCPVYVARGELGPPGPGALATEIVGALPDGHLLSFEDLSHFGPLENPATIAASLSEVLGHG